MNNMDSSTIINTWMKNSFKILSRSVIRLEHERFILFDYCSFYIILFYLAFNCHLQPYAIVVQLLSGVWFLATQWTAAHQAPCPSLSTGVCSNLCPCSQCAIQPFYPLLSPSPFDFNLSQHRSLFQWVCSLHNVAKY